MVIGRRLLNPSLWQQVPRDHRQTPHDFRRRQLVTVLFVLLGAVVLGLSLRIAPGNSVFYVATLVLAGVWATGAFASGPLYLGRIDVGEVLRRPVLQPVLIGLGLAAVFAVGGLLIHQVALFDPLDRQVTKVLAHADQGTGLLTLLVTVVNGLAEELFFRGAVYAAIPRNPVIWTTVVYGVATLATGNVMLAFAAVAVGFVVALQRRASGGVLAPMITHTTWSLVMLYALPAIFF
jgi:membrane protease YdiL (CAAX protease family)